jgi:hypothetical protein
MLKQCVEDANQRRHELNRRAEHAALAAHDATRLYHEAVDRLEICLREMDLVIEPVTSGE